MKVSITFLFDEEVLEKLDLLQTRLYLKDRGSVINWGLQLLEWYTFERDAKTKIFTENIEGKIENIGFSQIEEILEKHPY